jgi:cation diffusion facilitator family transporter
VAATCKQCQWCAEHVGGLNLWGNVGLVGVKLAGGILGHSQALIADAVHSLSDVAVAVLLLISLKVSATPPDKDHPWGHGNIEYIVATVIGALIICASVTITVVSLSSILEREMYDPGILAVWAAAISIAANEVMFRHSLCVGEQMASPAMIANAWENRADVYSSVAALIGVFGARLGFAFLDPVAAIVVGFMMARSGVSTLLVGIRGMTDRAFDRDMLVRVKKLAMQEKGVRDVARERARKIGQKNWIDVEVKFDAAITVSEVREIADRIKQNVMDEFEGIAGVVVVPRAAAPELKEV